MSELRVLLVDGALAQLALDDDLAAGAAAIAEYADGTAVRTGDTAGNECDKRGFAMVGVESGMIVRWGDCGC